MNPSDDEDGSFHDPESANTEEKLSVIEEHLGLPKQKEDVSFEEVEEKSYEPQIQDIVIKASQELADQYQDT